MSDIGIFSTFDLFVMALVAGSPGLVVGAIAGAFRRGHRIAGVVLGGAAGFALCLGAVIVWIFWIR